jgi:hypothetical protein
MIQFKQTVAFLLGILSRWETPMPKRWLEKKRQGQGERQRGFKLEL